MKAIEVIRAKDDPETVKVDPHVMTIDKHYPFVWGGVLVFAVKRSEKVIEFYAPPDQGVSTQTREEH